MYDAQFELKDASSVELLRHSKHIGSRSKPKWGYTFNLESLRLCGRLGGIPRADRTSPGPLWESPGDFPGTRRPPPKASLFIILSCFLCVSKHI